MNPELTGLESDRSAERLAALYRLVETNHDGILDVSPSEEVNNHVHTRYSFSPYSPSAVAYYAKRAGLQAVGSVDHDSIGAAHEMIDAARIVGIGSTVGCELRVDFADTEFADRKLNNPDTTGNAYIVIHGVPRSHIAAMERFLEPIRNARNERNARQVAALNEILAEYGVQELHFEDDVVGSSWYADGGTVTERHILYALSRRLVEHCGAGAPVVAFLRGAVGLAIPARVQAWLEDAENPHYLYDLLGVLKSSFLPRIFIQPGGTECRPVQDAVDFARSIGAIPAYSYLGDVAESPTGDKKAEKFEDDYVEALIPAVRRMGFQSVTYMPPRNTKAQLARLQALCDQNGLLQISGVDINSSRQSFTCPEVLDPMFRHLNETTWALIAHEKLAAHEQRLGFFAPDNPYARFDLQERIALYASIGRRSNPFRPEEMPELLPPV